MTKYIFESQCILREWHFDTHLQEVILLTYFGSWLKKSTEVSLQIFLYLEQGVESLPDPEGSVGDPISYIY